MGSVKSGEFQVSLWCEPPLWFSSLSAPWTFSSHAVFRWISNHLLSVCHFCLFQSHFVAPTLPSAGLLFALLLLYFEMLNQLLCYCTLKGRTRTWCLPDIMPTQTDGLVGKRSSRSEYSVNIAGQRPRWLNFQLWQWRKPRLYSVCQKCISGKGALWNRSACCYKRLGWLLSWVLQQARAGSCSGI